MIKQRFMQKFLLAILLCFSVVHASHAQEKAYRVGIFASIYLDSAFIDTSYQFENQMPRYILPGLDFVQGSMMAMDSLKSKQITFQIFDIRSEEQSIASLSANKIFDSLDLMIGSVAGNDYKMLTDLALAHKLPFVSATFPNDGGVRNNPYTILINATLPNHISSVHRYILSQWPTANIVWCRKKGSMEDRLQGYFNDANKGTGNSKLLNFRTVNLTDSLTTKELLPLLDSNRTNIVLAGSLDENFGRRLAQQLLPLQKSYKPQVIGMPTWENIKELQKSDFKELAIYFSATFYQAPNAKWGQEFTKTFTEKTFGRPSDLASKGFELTYYFANLLLQYGDSMMQHLNEKDFRLFTDFDFKPVSLNGTQIDYIENKRIYLLKRQQQVLTKVY